MMEIINTILADPAVKPALLAVAAIIGYQLVGTLFNYLKKLALKTETMTDDAFLAEIETIVKTALKKKTGK